MHCLVTVLLSYPHLSPNSAGREFLLHVHVEGAYMKLPNLRFICTVIVDLWKGQTLHFGISLEERLGFDIIVVVDKISVFQEWEPVGSIFRGREIRNPLGFVPASASCSVNLGQIP